MATQALAIKYRPKTFSDVVGQKVIKEILTYQIETGTFKNCYLFTGGAGTGKTTCARIFANDLNKGQGAPIEIDAASNNGVDDVRGIIDNAKLKALDTQYKVYILDEVHMLSNSAWNAMLKLIEEPPKSTIFIFCTTDPQKIPNTILSRVQRYDFQRIPQALIEGNIKRILEAEKISSFYENAIAQIAILADGGMRDALTALDKCLSLSKEITMNTVASALGIVSADAMMDLLDSYYDNQYKDIVSTIETIHKEGKDLKQFLKQFLQFLLDVGLHLVNEKGSPVPILVPYLDSLEEIRGAQGESLVKSLLRDVTELISLTRWESSPRHLILAKLILGADKWAKEAK